MQWNFFTPLLLRHLGSPAKAAMHKRRIALFLPREALLARYMLWPCARVCVCLSQVGVLLKRLNVGSRRDSSFLTPKILGKFDRGHPQRGRQMQVG